jgi:hypothetical protein
MIVRVVESDQARLHFPEGSKYNHIYSCVVDTMRHSTPKEILDKVCILRHSLVILLRVVQRNSKG